MANLINRVLNFVGWESDEEEAIKDQEPSNDEFMEPGFSYFLSRKQSNKVVNIHQSNQFKVVVMQPESYDDAQEICDHLKNKKTIVINLEFIEKEGAQRIVDFLSGAVYALDGNIQKITSGIFLIAPNNVDILGDFKDEFKYKGIFPWVK